MSTFAEAADNLRVMELTKHLATINADLAGIEAALNEGNPCYANVAKAAHDQVRLALKNLIAIKALLTVKYGVIAPISGQR